MSGHDSETLDCICAYLERIAVALERLVDHAS